MFSATRSLLQQQRQPMIKFLGKRTTPRKVDHTPHAHPASPSDTLPKSFTGSFAQYRDMVQTPGESSAAFSPSSSSSASSLGRTKSMAEGKSASPGGRVHDRSGASLGSITPPEGELFDRSELPKRFQRTSWSAAEIDAVDSGGATAFGW